MTLIIRIAFILVIVLLWYYFTTRPRKAGIRYPFRDKLIELIGAFYNRFQPSWVEPAMPEFTPVEIDSLETEIDYEEQDQYEAECKDDILESLRESPLYNKLITIPVNKGKGKRNSVSRRLVHMLVNNNGDLVPALSPKVYEYINGCLPKRTVYYDRYYNGNVPTEEAIDCIYSELGYNSAQELMDDARRIVKGLRK